jgi:hypothetical protein
VARLGAANRAQAKCSSVRLIVPRAPEAAQELGMDLTDEQFLSVEKYLEDQGYIAPADVSLTWSAYTITSAGYEWLGADLSDQEIALAAASGRKFQRLSGRGEQPSGSATICAPSWRRLEESRETRPLRLPRSRRR